MLMMGISCLFSLVTNTVYYASETGTYLEICTWQCGQLRACTCLALVWLPSTPGE